jgi:hypothetical protein
MSLKLNKGLLLKIALIIFGAIAGIAGYEVVQGNDSVTITLPAEEAPAKAKKSKKAKAAKAAKSKAQE